MEQKTAKIAKRQLWSVYVFVEREIQEGRSMARRRRLTASVPDRQISGPTHMVEYKYLHLNVTKIYKKNGILYIQVGVGKKKINHMYDMKSVIGIQAREHDRSGRIQ